MNPGFERYIEEAMVKSYQSLPKLPGNTLFIVDVSGSMFCCISRHSDVKRKDAAAAMAMLAANQCESFRIVCTAGDDSKRQGKHKQIPYPEKGFGIISQISEANIELGGGGIFTRQALEWCKERFKDETFDRIIVFTDSQDCDFPDRRKPEPFGTFNYICDVSANTHGINYKGVWTAEISGFSEHFLTFIGAMEGLSNEFES